MEKAKRAIERIICLDETYYHPILLGKQMLGV
jgi:hypothetical protein